MEVEEFEELARKFWPCSYQNLQSDVYWDVTGGDEDTFQEFIEEIENLTGCICTIEFSKTFPFVWSSVALIEGWLPSLAKRIYKKKYRHMSMGDVFENVNGFKET